MVLRELRSTGSDEADADSSGRELHDDRQRSGSCGEPRASRIEAGEQPGEVVAQRQRRRCGNERADLLTRTKEQRFHRRLRDAERPTKLVIRESAHLAQDERAPLTARKAGDRRPDRLEIRGSDRHRERIGEV